MQHKLLLTVFISTFLTFTSIDAQLGDPIPPEFKCPDCILVILKPENPKTLRNYEKNVEKEFKKYYTGKYEIATVKDLETDSRYQDKKTYKFSLNYKTRDEIKMYPDPKGGMKEVIRTYLSFYLYNRETSTQYRTLGEQLTWAKSLERTAKALDGSYK